VALGLVAAGVLSRVLASQLYGVGATDPATYVGVAIALLLVALTAAYLPARRVARLDPVAALRGD
jgi:ABC-type antimicrobial peptide transport system permease subunit